MDKINELKEKLNIEVAEVKMQEERKQRIHELNQQIFVEKRNEENKREQEVIKEKEQLIKKAVHECTPYFKCPNCKKEVEITRTKHIVLTTNPRCVILEGDCSKCGFDIKHRVNDVLKNLVCYKIINESGSVYKWATRGYM
jgi:hypothetical protein